MDIASTWLMIRRRSFRELQLNRPSMTTSRAKYLTPASALRRYLDLGADPLFQGRYVWNDTDQLALLLQARESFQGGFEGFLIQSAESFIKEQRIHPDILAGHVGQTQRQGKADNKALAAGKILRGPNFSGLVVVDHVKFQGLSVIADQQVAVGHFLQLPVGMTNHHFECQTLGKIAVLLTVCWADQFM